MGAAEWTGYTNSSPTYPTPTYSALPPPGPAPPSATSYGYELANMDHPSNYHIPLGEPQAYTILCLQQTNFRIFFFRLNLFSSFRNAIVLFIGISKSFGISGKFIGIGASIIVGWQ